MEVKVLSITGSLGKATPSFIINDVGRRCGIYVNRFGDIDSMITVLNLASHLNLNCGTKVIIEEGNVNWSNMSSLINPNVRWPPAILKNVFMRFLPIFDRPNMRDDEDEWREKIQVILCDSETIELGDPTPSNVKAIPLYLAYGIAIRHGYQFSLTSTEEELLNAMLYIRGNRKPDMACIPQEIVDRALMNIPLQYNPWYKPIPRSTDNEDPMTYYIQKAAEEYNYNLLYCKDPRKEYSALRQHEELGAEDPWFRLWHQRNPQYFQCNLRFDSNIPVKWIAKGKLLSRYNCTMISELSNEPYILERGPIPGAGPCTNSDIIAIHRKGIMKITPEKKMRQAILKSETCSELPYSYNQLLALYKHHKDLGDTEIMTFLHELRFRDQIHEELLAHQIHLQNSNQDASAVITKELTLWKNQDTENIDPSLLKTLQQHCNQPNLTAHIDSYLESLNLDNI